MRDVTGIDFGFDVNSLGSGLAGADLSSKTGPAGPSHRKRTRCQARSSGYGTSTRLKGKDTSTHGVEDAEEAKEEAEEVAEEVAGSPGKRLACPFYKFDRVGHLDCAHFHLRRVKDVKQHLLRKHKFYCKGCCEGFRDRKKCLDHVNGRQCRLGSDSRADAIVEGISECQKAKLMKRMHSGTRGEEHSWYSIWEILFPAQPTPASPFLNSGVEEVISTVCDLWQKNGPTVLSSFNSAQLPTDMVTETGQTEKRSCPFFGTTSDHLLRLLEQLAKVSVPQSNDGSIGSATAQPCLPKSGSNPPPVSHASPTRHREIRPGSDETMSLHQLEP
ncbi:hypothetical protein LZ30DRAFT_91690 [Colletotrichum cereale]|nr:hypothetical protein LZ30DRAFT_91690 [Colletotrichum cereale]